MIWSYGLKEVENRCHVAENLIYLVDVYECKEHVAAAEMDGVLLQSIQIRRLYDRVTHIAQVLVIQLVDHEKQHIRAVHFSAPQN